MENEINHRIEIFKKDVLDGLTHFPKFLSSKYFYDEKGDELFQEIMAMPSYYLTDCEFDIISEHTKALAEKFIENAEDGLDLIELGAGDGKKTKILLRYMVDHNMDFVYKPIDISSNILKQLKDNLTVEFPDLRVDEEVGEYFEVLEELKKLNKRKKVILMLGSNVGNLLHPRAIEFLSKIGMTMNDQDMLFVGFDQMKNPQTILDAYNDDTKITEAFNKNILFRINRELGGNFDVDKFIHWPAYNPETGTTKSFLVAKEAMEVRIQALDLNVHFDQWESIHTEISQKYTDNVVSWLIKEAGLKIITSFADKNSYYKNYIIKRV